jgi:hypothetical protein
MDTFQGANAALIIRGLTVLIAPSNFPLATLVTAMRASLHFVSEIGVTKR